jgi:cytochrome c oxidase subunit 4
MEFHDDYPQYEFMAHHSEEEGVIKRKKLWRVFWIMLVVTILELIIGSKAHSLGLLNPDDRTSTVPLKFIFIGLTLLKAFYIVFKFMHLGDEKKWMKYCILAPYMIFIIYLIFIIVGEANYCRIHKEKMDQKIIDQKEMLNKNAYKEHPAGEEAEGEKKE